MKKKNKQSTSVKTSVNQPLVSVIMPVKNTEKFLVAAIESIRAQTYKNWEMIIVNDGSTDKTGKILSSYVKQDKRIKVITFSQSKGIATALNWALKFAQGKFIARMDGDDISLPNRLKLQVEYLQTHPLVVAVGGQAEMIDVNGQVFAEKRFPTDANTLREMIMWVVPIQHPIMMARAEMIKKYRYEVKMKTAEDVDMFMKLFQEGEFSNLSQVVYQYRKSNFSNGYHQVKTTFYWTLWARLQGILKFGYQPSLKGVILSLIQLLIVSLLPSSVVVNLYESKRFVWLRQKVTGVLVLQWLRA